LATRFVGCACIVEHNTGLDDDDDDEVDWEDGDDAECEVDANIILPLSPQLPVHGMSTCTSLPQLKIESSTNTASFIADNFTVSTSELFRSPPKTGKSSVFSKETSDALIQAQVMASQLTDRAGRSFRRAIKEAHGGDTYNNGAGESSNDDDDVDSSSEYEYTTETPLNV
jgi:hypothetical protein